MQGFLIFATLTGIVLDLFSLMFLISLY